MTYKRPEFKTVTIASGESTSEPIYVWDRVLANVRIPATFDGTAITVVAGTSPTDTFKPLYADDAEVSIDVAGDRIVAFVGEEAAAVASCVWIKLVSNQTEQGDRELVVTLKG